MLYSKSLNCLDINVSSRSFEAAHSVWAVVKPFMDRLAIHEFGRYHESGIKTIANVYVRKIDTFDIVKVLVSGPEHDVGRVIDVILDAGYTIEGRSVERETYQSRRPRITAQALHHRCGASGECRVRGIDIDELLRREALRELGEDW